MNISWFTEEKTGSASFYATNITLNAIAMIPFDDAEYALVGVDEGKRVILRPITMDMKERGSYEGQTLFTVASKSSYARISSTPLCSFLSKQLGIPFGKTPVKGSTVYDPDVGLIITIGGNE